MALKNYYTKEEHEMQELVQKQIDLAGFGGEGFTEKQVNQIHEYAQMVGDELRVRSLIWTDLIRNGSHSLWMMPEKKWRFIQTET